MCLDVVSPFGMFEEKFFKRVLVLHLRFPTGMDPEKWFAFSSFGITPLCKAFILYAVRFT